MQHQECNNWRRERNWIPTFSRRIMNAFAALRAIHLKAQNGSANAAPIIRESPSTRDSRGFEDPLATAELRNAFLAAKPLQHDADLALRRKMPPRRGGCPSQTFPPAPSPAPGDGIGPEVMAEVEKIATRFTSEGIVHFKVEKDLWAAPPMPFTNSDQRCRHGARARSGGRGAACRRRRAEMGCRPL